MIFLKCGLKGSISYDMIEIHFWDKRKDFRFGIARKEGYNLSATIRWILISFNWALSMTPGTVLIPQILIAFVNISSKYINGISETKISRE